jgi:hypothetical protein
VTAAGKGTDRKRKPPTAKALANLEKGRFKPGQSGNPKGGALRRPLVEATVAYYREDPKRLTDLVDTMHRGAIGEIELSNNQVAAFQCLQRVVDQMHRKQDGTERVVQESITVILPSDGRAPERAKMTLDVVGESRPTFELPPDPDDPRDATP